MTSLIKLIAACSFAVEASMLLASLTNFSYPLPLANPGYETSMVVNLRRQLEHTFLLRRDPFAVRESKVAAGC